MADIVNDGNLGTDEDWDPPQLPAQNVQAQFGSLPPGLASPSADSMAPAPNSKPFDSCSGQLTSKFQDVCFHMQIWTA